MDLVIKQVKLWSDGRIFDMYAIIINGYVGGIRESNSGSLLEGQYFLPIIVSGSYNEENEDTHKKTFKKYDIQENAVIAEYNYVKKTEQEIYEDKLNQGYVDSITGIKLKTTQSAQNAFSQTMILMKNVLPAGEYSIWDYNDVELSINKIDIIALLERYGTYCYQLFCDYAP